MAHFLNDFELQSNQMLLSGLFKASFKSDKLASQARMDLFVSAFENNYSLILAYLPHGEQARAKLICRGVYYLSITNQIWFGLREEVIDRKMENFEDIEFVEEEEAKAVTKQQKQIRIHSLKKNTSNVRVREASNIKQKKIAINAMNNQLPFRSTEIGFKRLLKTNTASKKKISASKQPQNILLDLIEIPKQWTIKDLLINVKQPWSLNVQRASNLCFVVKRWNEFHHRVIAELKLAEKDLSSLVKKCIRVDNQLTQYFQQFQAEPYCSLRTQLMGSEKQLLIDEQLNKLGNVFVSNHNSLCSISKSLEQFISKTHEALIKISKLQSGQQESTWAVQYLSVLQQLIQEYSKLSSGSPQLLKLQSRSILEIIDSLLEQFHHFQVQASGEVIEVVQVGMAHISRRSDFFEILFESLANCYGGTLKIGESGESDVMGMSLTLNKFKSMKTISYHLWNISKYFSKLMKQLQSKEKKGASSKQTSIIRSFLSSYEGQKAALIDWKNPQRVEKEVMELKQRVGNLKGMMQGE